MFRFTIRELCLFTIIVALVAAWWMDHQRLSAQLQEGKLWRLRFILADELAHEGKAIGWDYERLGIKPPKGAKRDRDSSDDQQVIQHPKNAWAR